MPGAAPHCLFVSFPFPPMTGTSGVHRPLGFVRSLSRAGWSVTVLTVSPAAYPQRSDELVGRIPASVKVVRAFARDTARHLTIRGAYPRLAALPDRWVSWLLGAVPAGVYHILRRRPNVVCSTYPIASAHLIAYMLHRISGVPWVADFRDPMVDAGYPSDPRTRRAHAWIDRRTAEFARKLLFTTPGMVRDYRRSYPDRAACDFVCIGNGYDEASFEDVDRPAVGRLPEGRTFLLHSGVVYPVERDPRPFFAALRELLDAGMIAGDRFTVRLRATSHDSEIAGFVEAFGVGAVVEIAPPIPHRDAIAEMLGADGLVVMQADNSKHQIPAKVYEYLRAGRPVLALTGRASDTGRLLEECGVRHVAALESSAEIKATLLDFLAQLRAGTVAAPDRGTVAAFSRDALGRSFERLLRDVARLDPQNHPDGPRDIDEPTTRR